MSAGARHGGGACAVDAHRVPMLGSCALAVAVLTFFASASEPRAQAAISSAAAATSNLASRAMPPPGVEFDATMRGRILQQSQAFKSNDPIRGY